MTYLLRWIPVLIIVVVFILFFRCGDKMVGPSNPRKLTWSADTLAHPDNFQTGLSDIWGSAPDNVYAVGSASTTRGIIWHFDGQGWSNVRISITQDGPIAGTIGFEDVFGFSSRDFWVVGKRRHSNTDPSPFSRFSSLLIHGDSGAWEDIQTPEGSVLTAVWGRSSDNLWIAGINGTLFHYDGVSVKKDSIPLNIPKDADPVYNVLSLTGTAAGEVYMLLTDFGGSRTYFLENTGLGWVVTDSTFFHNSHRLRMSSSETLYVAGESTYKRQGNAWIEILNGRTTLAAIGIDGTDDNNIVVVGTSNLSGFPGAVYHYDGVDWSEIIELRLPNNFYSDVWTDGREVFIVGSSGNDSVIVHGK